MSLPPAPSPVPAAAARDALAASSLGLTDARILVVDDEEMNLRVVGRMLSRAGFENVQTLSDARQVAARVAEWQPALLLIDLHMPHQDGFTVIEQLRSCPGGTRQTAMLLFTGDGVAGLRDRAAALGIAGFVTKPFDMREALGLIRATLIAAEQVETAA